MEDEVAASVEVVAYSPAWPALFEQERAALRAGDVLVLPEPSGPWPAGATPLWLTDTSRPDPGPQG